MILSHPVEVAEALSALDLRLVELTGALRRGQVAADMCTASHPAAAPGSYAYYETNAGLRESLGLRGWLLSEAGCIPRAVFPEACHSITAVAGDANTGQDTGTPPTTKRPRRRQGIRLIQQNASQPNFPEWVAGGVVTELPHANEVGDTWFLLFARSGRVVRSEVSLAIEADENGEICRWRSRIVLPAIDLDEPDGEDLRGRPRHPGSAPIEVPVVRRAG